MTPFEDFRMIVDNNLITISTDLEGNILYASQAYCNISGYSCEELKLIHINSLIHSDVSMERIERLWRVLYEMRTWSGELKLPKKRRRLLLG